MRPAYHLAPELTPDDRQQLGRVVRSLTVLADVSHADLMVFGRGADDAPVILVHAQPGPVPSLYSESLVGRRFSADQAPLVQRMLSRRGARPAVSHGLVRGAPSVQELFPIRRPSGETIAVVQSEMALLEHERQRKRSIVLRKAISQLRQLVLQGRLEGAERLSRLKVHDGIMVVDAQGKIQYLSAVAEHLYFRLGYAETLVDTLLSELDTNEYVYFKAIEQGECLEQRIQEQGVMWIKKAIPLFPIEARGTFAGLLSRRTTLTGAIIVLEDVTDEARKEQELKIKSAMIQEIHHRVKNNLQTIAALLRMQARRASSDEVAETLRQSVSRILSIAVVHEFLSKDESSAINIHEVCNRILSEVTRGTLGPDKQVRLHLEGSNAFVLPAQQATSCALIINELLQNSVEHGYAEQSEGDIYVRLAQTEDSMSIEIQDDGQGLPEGFNVEQGSGLGLQIVNTLVREDLKGRFELQNGVGVRALISFPRRYPEEARVAVQ